MLGNILDIFHSEINPGERIIWSGQPHQGFILRREDTLMIPISLLYGVFVIFWEYSALTMGAPFFFSLVGILFVLYGLYFIFGRFYIDMVQRSKTYYALTEKRIVIISGLRNQNIKTLELKKLPEINISIMRNGSGTITFGSSHPSWMYSGSWFLNPGRYNNAPGFDMIDDVKMVYQSIKRLQIEGV